MREEVRVGVLFVEVIWIVIGGWLNNLIRININQEIYFLCPAILCLQFWCC